MYFLAYKSNKCTSFSTFNIIDILSAQFSGNSQGEHTNIDGKACNNIPNQLINLLCLPTWTILVKLGVINMIPLFILSKTQKVLSQGKILAT